MEILINFISDKPGLSPAEVQIIERAFTLLIALPIVTTVTGIFRHVIGFKSSSLVAPIILTYAFYELGYRKTEYVNLQLGKFVEPDYLRGLELGVLLFIIVFASSTLIYTVLRQVRMHYIPKTTLVLMGVTLTLIFAIFGGLVFFDRNSLVYVDTFTIVMIVALSNNFISTLSRKNIESAAGVAIQTLVIATISYSVIAFETTRDIIYNYGLLIILILLFVNLYIGKLVGLRLTEYWRFRDILVQESNTGKKNGRKDTKNKKKQKESTRS